MRRNIEVGDKLVTLQSEIDLVEYYLKIQKYRFGDKITYGIEIRCDINKYKIMPLIIQPIVENAFVHGLESKEGSGEICILIEEQENLIIHVQDNGVGIEGAILYKIRENLSNDEELDRTSIGLSNVNQRIKLLYGERYGIIISSTKDIGTCVDIILPKGVGI
jgi:two-component system sensor histidine kinase YesM